MRKRVVLAIVIMGFSGLVAEIVLLRELLVAFHGNELSIGIVFANWLLLESAGAFFLGKRISNARWNLGIFVLTTVLFTLFFPAAVYAARVFKDFLPVVAGEGLGMLPMFYVSFLVLLPVSLLHGALFTSGCKLYHIYQKDGVDGNERKRKKGAEAGTETALPGGKPQPGISPNPQEAGFPGSTLKNGERPLLSDLQGAFSISRIYIYETAGTIAGGLILTYILIPWIDSVKIALVVALINISICSALLNPFRKGPIAIKEKIAGIFTVLLAPVTMFLLIGNGAEKIHFSSLERQWRGQNLIDYRNSHYGNIVVTESGGEYTFYSDGLPAITTPNPDIVYIEEFVHFPMLSHPAPDEILILSGGAGGVIREVLKHEVNRVDYAEVDPMLPGIIKKYPTSLTVAELEDPRVNTMYVDGRFFLKRTDHVYDVIFSGFGDPSSLQTNRFFTREFFSLAKSRLSEDGILVLALPGSLTYMSDELADLNVLTINTLRDVFPHVRIIPGDGKNIYLASKSGEVTEVPVAGLSERIEKRNLKLDLVSPGYLEYRLDQRWLDWFMVNTEGSTGEKNLDFKPLGVFYSLIYWNEQFSPAFNNYFARSENINLFYAAIVVLLFFLILASMSSWMKNPVKPAISFCIFSTGFAGMLFDLILIFAFQVIYGYIFYWLGLLVTAFMAGVMAGGLWMSAYLKRRENTFTAIIKLEFAVIAFAVLLPWIFINAGTFLVYQWFDYLLKGIFLLLSFASGILVGGEFPLANREYLKMSPNLGGTAGLLYSSDLMGGWLGGIIGGVVLLPVLGLLETSLVIAMVKIASLVLLVLKIRGNAVIPA